MTANECPDCGGSGIHTTYDGIDHGPCPTCKGTGAMTTYRVDPYNDNGPFRIFREGDGHAVALCDRREDADLIVAALAASLPVPTEDVRCGRCAWCLNDHAPRQRGYELTCPHGFGCCQNCTAGCRPSPIAAVPTVPTEPKEQQR